jgi:hypothetical protein
MWPLLKVMLREEWRLHTTLFDQRLIALFPVVVTLLAAVSTLLLPIVLQVMPGRDVVLMGQYTFLVLGAGVGAFGLMGRDLFTRRFGQTQHLVVAVRTLPITDRTVMAGFLMKDVLFYLFLWIGPAVLGFGLMAPAVNVHADQILLLVVSLPLSFLMGLAMVSALSTAYAQSAKIFMAVVMVAAIGMGMGAISFDVNAIRLLPTYVFVWHPGVMPVITTGSLIALSLMVSLALPPVDFPQRHRHVSNTFIHLKARLPADALAPYVAKDLLDLWRSEGGMGKIIFSLLMPAGMIWLFFYVLEEFVPGLDFLMIFALFVGLIASSMYNWLTDLDAFAAYTYLPVSVSTVLKGKVRSYVLLNAVPVVLLAGVALLHGTPAALPAALLVFVGISAYTVSISVYLTGLFPTVLLHNVKVFGLYTLLIAPLLVLLLMLSTFHPVLPAASILLCPLAYVIMQHGYRRWDAWEPLTGTTRHK